MNPFLFITLFLLIPLSGWSEEAPVIVEETSPLIADCKENPAVIGSADAKYSAQCSSTLYFYNHGMGNFKEPIHSNFQLWTNTFTCDLMNNGVGIMYGPDVNSDKTDTRLIVTAVSNPTAEYSSSTTIVLDENSKKPLTMIVRNEEGFTHSITCEITKR